MPSGIVILAAYNHEDQFLVGNPEISHFRSVYKHHKPFATEFRKISFDTRATLGQDSIVVDFPKDGDLIKSIYLRAKFNYRTFSEVSLSYGEVKDFMSSKTVSKSFKELINNGWIEKTKHGGLYGGTCAYKFNGKFKEFYYKGFAV